VSRLLRVAIAALAFAFGLASASVAARHGANTTYAGRSGLAEMTELATGWALVAAGLLLFARPDWRRTATVVTLAGFASFASDWAGWEGGPNGMRSVGVLALGLVFALIFDAVATWTPPPRDRAIHVALAVVYTETILVAVGRAVLRDPLQDPHCWSDCTARNVFLVHRDRDLARALDFVDLRFAVAAGAALALIAAWRIARAARPARRRLAPVLVPGAAFGLVHAAGAVALLGGRTEDATAAAFVVLFAARSLALVGVAVGLIAALMRVRATRRAVGRLAEDLGEAPAPGTLESAMSQAVGDASLRVAYRLSGSGDYVDRDGRRVDITPRAGRAVTPIVRGEAPVAVVIRDPDALEDAVVADAIGAAARLAVDNERLAAEARARLVELRASRARIVATADAERRRLERDLHDGAQQQLLALSYDLRLAWASAVAAADGELAADLEAALQEADAALGELRELAHGIYPAVLEESGLEAALRTLAEVAPLPVELDLSAHGRTAAAVERAAYVTVAEAVADAAARHATYVRVEVSRANGSLNVKVRDNGEARSAELPQVADRLGALQGMLELQPTAVEAEIPCE
jgi:signal transduction histidine kinase